MIRFEPSQHWEPEPVKEVQWRPAIGAGLVAGVILIVMPRGSPWEALTFFSPTVLGRSVSSFAPPLIVAWTLHLMVCLIYGLIVSRAVAHLNFEKAILVGGVVGAALYVANFGIFSAFWPGARGNELSVLLTHIVFGLLAAGVYRGLLRRSAPKVRPA